jgi:hypothetical protein
MSSSDVFLNSRRVCSDDCAKEARDNQNDALYGYNMYRHAYIPCETPNPRMPNFTYEHVNLRGRVGYGLADDCLVDQYSELRNAPTQLTRDRCPIQLFGRVFKGCPNLKPGVPNPDLEMPITQGMSSSTLEGIQYPCKKAIMEETTNKFMPMQECVKEIQEPQHVVEPWIRGGDDTRNYVKRMEFLAQCGAPVARR